MSVLGRGISSLIPQKEDKTVDPLNDLLQSNSSHEKGGSKRDLLTPKTNDRGTKKSKKPVSRSTYTANLAESAQNIKENSLADLSQNTSKLLPVPGASFGELLIASIIPNAKQPRHVFDESYLQELSDSIKEVGVLQPIVVRPIANAEQGQPRYELIMGERRWRASKRAGLEKIPAIVRRTDEDDVLRDALLENLHRVQLNPLEEASAYKQLLEDFNCTQEQLAERIARSRSQITNTLRLLKLPASVQKYLQDGTISAGHARALLSLENIEEVEKLALKIIEEGLSVRAVEDLVNKGMTAQKPVIKAPVPKPQFEKKAQRLNKLLNAPVSIAMGKRKGKIVIEFKGDEDLERLIELLSK